MSMLSTTMLTTAMLFSSAVATPTDSKAAGSEYRTMIDTASPCLITVKFVLKFQGPQGTRDFEREITATMIDKSGLVLCSGVQLGTSKLFRRMGTATPTDMKILIGDDTVGIDAELLATDGELDLAWIRVKDAKSLPATVQFVDFTRPQTASLGDRVLSVNRMEKFFDRAPVVTEGRIAGSTKKPREMLVPGGGIDLEPGMPVFAANGNVIGVAVFQSPDAEDMEGARGSNATLILPTDQLNKATKRALAAAAEEMEEEDDGIVTPTPAKDDASEDE